MTEAQRRTASPGPRSPTTPSGVTTATAAVGAGHEPIWSSASTVGDTSGDVDRQIVSSGSPYEPVVGYSRAVRVGDRVFVAGSAPIMADGSDPPADAYGQAKRCLEIVGNALREAGASLEDVVRTRVYLTNAAAFDGFAKAHGEAFSEVRPANTTVVVAALLDPRWLLEIEAEAVVSS